MRKGGLYPSGVCNHFVPMRDSGCGTDCSQSLFRPGTQRKPRVSGVAVVAAAVLGW